MIVTRLNLTNLRAIETAEFHFQPGFNLIVGVNGVGKTSVLDALRICVSRVLPSITASRTKAMSFGVEDIRNGKPFLDATVQLDVAGKEFRFTRLQWREHVAVDDSANLDSLRRQILNTERLRERARNLLRELERSQGLTDSDSYAPAQSELRRAVKQLISPPLSVFYSTNRSVVSARRASAGRTVGGSSAAYADALVPRSWNTDEFADWMRVQMALALENPIAAKHIAASQAAAARFLPECSDLRPSDDTRGILLLDKAGISLDVRQLSDGERGILSMALDLARRLSQANPGLADPLQEAQAIVLIDEIDLHLHPKWQRQIVHNLSNAFPRCQFIATTHSPQVIGEVPRDRVHLLAANEVRIPSVAYGADSNWILDHIMEGSASVNTEAIELEREVEDAIADAQLHLARNKLERWRRLLDGETTAIARLDGSLSSLELLARKSDVEEDCGEDN